MIMVLVRNWSHLLTLCQNPDSSTQLFEHRLLSKVLTLPIQFIPSALHVFTSFCNTSSFLNIINRPISSLLLSFLLKRVHLIHLREIENNGGTMKADALHWDAFFRVHTMLFYFISRVILRPLLGDPLKTPPYIWDFVTSITLSASLPQKQEMLAALTTHINPQILKDPQAPGLANLLRGLADPPLTPAPKPQ